MKILFVCTGNSCRSPMAEALARDIFDKMHLDIEVASAGVSVLMALPASENAVEVMKTDYWLDISEHKTRQITRDDILEADIVLGMTERHKDYLALQAPGMTDKFSTIARFAGHMDAEVSDPFGGDLEQYRKCAAQLRALVTDIGMRLKGERDAALAIACDKAGFELKTALMRHMDKRGIAYKDYGCDGQAAVDYPVYAKKVVDALLGGECTRGVLVCGTGIGISIAANRHSGIRAALCHDVFSAKAARSHNDANILAMGGRVIGPGPAAEVLDAFLGARFSGEPRHINRINQIERL